MDRKEKMNLLLSKVEEGKKEAFIAALREAKTKEERFAAAEEFGVKLTKEEIEAMKGQTGHELSDDMLDEAAGGGCCAQCGCHCGCG